MAGTFSASYGPQVKEHLRDAIIAGEFKPGERINEVKLAGQLGISRTPLREAVSALASEGWIEQTPHKGSRVAEFNTKSIHDLLDVRQLLEVGALHSLMSHADRDQKVVDLAEVAEKTGQALLTKTFYPETASDFHLCLLRSSGNGLLAEIGSTVLGKLRLVRFRAGVASERRDSAMAEHQQIVAALRQGDEAAAEKALRLHLEHAAGQIREGITSSASNDT